MKILYGAYNVTDKTPVDAVCDPLREVKIPSGREKGREKQVEVMDKRMNEDMTSLAFPPRGKGDRLRWMRA